MAEGGEVAELEVVVAFELVVLADGGEDFGLFDGVDAEVGFEVEVGVQQVGGVAGHLGDDRGDRVDDVVTTRCGVPRRLRLRALRLAAVRWLVGGVVPVRSRTQVATWRRVGKSRSWRLSSRSSW